MAESCSAGILNQESMQNMAAIQFVFKINSKLSCILRSAKTLVSQLTKLFLPFFYWTETRKMKETNL